MEDTSQQVDSSIEPLMGCVTVKIISKTIHSKWTQLFWLEWGLLQWTLSGRYFTVWTLVFQLEWIALNVNLTCKIGNSRCRNIWSLG